MTTIVEAEKEINSIVGLAEHLIDGIKETTPDPVMFDLGCGRKKLPIDGVKGVDYYLDTDVQADLFGEWTFTPDDSVDFLYSSHLLEHIPDLNGFMAQAWRKLKHGGLFLITTPYGFSIRAWQDPDHKRPIFRETYWYFNKQSRMNMGVEHYESDCNFDMVNMWPVWNKKYASRAMNNADLAEQFMTTFNAVDDLTALLRAVKS